jgi:transposase InsO family protein
MDLYSRKIVGWAMADHLRAELPLAALAAWRRPDSPFRSWRSIRLGGVSQHDAVRRIPGFDEPQGRLL